jgi:acetylornithine deacetylase/succinyl-diaminopimelate desuccinylase-like protein
VPDRELAALASDLVAIDSANPALIAGAAGEVEIAKFVAEWSERAGLEVEVIEPVAGPASLGESRAVAETRLARVRADLERLTSL